MFGMNKEENKKIMAEANGPLDLAATLIPFRMYEGMDRGDLEETQKGLASKFKQIVDMEPIERAVDIGNLLSARHNIMVVSHNPIDYLRAQILADEMMDQLTIHIMWFSRTNGIPILDEYKTDLRPGINEIADELDVKIKDAFFAKTDHEWTPDVVGQEFMSEVYDRILD